MIEFNDKCRRKFVVHEHNARRAGLHYDIRVLGFRNDRCILYSWATRNLPKLLGNKTDKIAIFPTEDHELKWLNFEGEIEEGYGAGTVKIYDKGSFEVVSQKDKSVVLNFKGSKLKGLYAFVRTGAEYDLLVKVKNVPEINTTANITPYNSFSIQRIRRRLRKRIYPNMLLGIGGDEK